MGSKMRSNMAVNIIGAISLLLILFGVIVSAQGYVSFTNAFKKEYATSTYHMADMRRRWSTVTILHLILRGRRPRNTSGRGSIWTATASG